MSDRVWPKIMLAELAIVAVIALGITALVRGASGADPDDRVVAAASPTVALADLPDGMATFYRYAGAHLAEFAQVPCYCGCDGTLAHRHLADCFVNDDGDWDAHAAGCAVCTNEAAVVREQLDTGASIQQVRDSIVERFGPPPSIFTRGAQA